MQQDYSIPAGSSGANQNAPGLQRPNKSKESLKSILSTVAILLAAPLMALVLTAFVFQTYEVDGPSMETTLQDRDRLIVWKLPKTLSKLGSKAHIPKRGEIVVFVKHGLEESPGKEKQLIKRVIGLPGDRVVVRDGAITVYNDEHPDGFDPDKNQEFSGSIQDGTTGSVDLMVPKGEIFVAGDNRPKSLDSRSFGTVAVKDVVGELAFRIIPIDGFKSF